MIIWDDKYLIGVEEIDTQQKELFKLCRKFELLMQVPDGVYIADEALKLLCELRNYMTFHFYWEERYMKEKKFQNFESHKKEHDEFTRDILNIDIDSVFNGNNNEMKILMNLLYGWLLNHVQVKDLELRNL